MRHFLFLAILACIFFCSEPANAAEIEGVYKNEFGSVTIKKDGKGYRVKIQTVNDINNATCNVDAKGVLKENVLVITYQDYNNDGMITVDAPISETKLTIPQGTPDGGNCGMGAYFQAEFFKGSQGIQDQLSN